MTWCIDFRHLYGVVGKTVVSSESAKEILDIKFEF